MLDALHEISTSTAKQMLKGVDIILDWAILNHPEQSSFYQEVKKNSVLAKDWIKPVAATKKFGTFQKSFSKMQQNHSWKPFKILDRGTSCVRAGLATLQLMDKYKFAVFSAVTSIFCKRVSLAVNVLGDMVSVARRTRRVFKIYSEESAAQEELKKSCLCLGLSVYALVRSLICVGAGFYLPI